jgi:hypothetical protein
MSQNAPGPRCVIRQSSDELTVEVQGSPSDSLETVVSAAHQEHKHFSEDWTAVTEIVDLTKGDDGTWR